MLDLKEDMGSWQIGISDTEFERRYSDALAEAIKQTPGAGDLGLEVKAMPSRNMGLDGGSIYTLILIAIGTETVKTMTREVVAPIMKEVVKRVHAYLVSEPSDEITEADPQDKA